jgi:multidrug efflux pump subunit AcrA (membrane-fusion protein)
VAPAHAGRKLALTALVMAAGAMAFVDVEHRVTAKGQIQGEMRRLVGAPFDGYIKRQYARAGEIVRANDLLAELEENDLVLDRLRQVAHRRQYQLELDRALAKREIAAANIAQAQIAQTDAEIDLSDQMLARTRIRAPYDAVVVSGDLSQSVGRPVSRGDTLFELAPLDRYRVTAIVPEADIQSVASGQTARLLLAAIPEQTFDMVVVTVTPVAQVVDGVNGFEVIGTIVQHDARVRPGMEGVAKIAVGERRLVWIWTHEFLHWLRIKLWTWLP